MALAGLIFTTSASTARGTDLRASARDNLADAIRAEGDRTAQTDRRVQALRSQVDELARAGGAGDVGAQAARADAFAAPAGATPVSGTGLRISLDDAPRTVGQALPSGASPDDLVVHQQDVQGVVNALWAGGAQALQLMDQRVVSTSAVRCVGNTLVLQGRVYPPPYVVTAVGPVATMRAALQRSRAVGLYREYVAVYGLRYDERSLARVIVPAYEADLDLVHAQAAS